MSTTTRWLAGFTATLLAGIAAALLASLAPTPTPVAAQTVEYSCSLEGASEVPATTSSATGKFTATFDERAQTVTWSLNLPSITNATLAHIHAGATGVNGPPVVTLFTSVPAGSIAITGTSRPADIGGPFTGNWDGFIAALKAGEVYVNVHTTANPGGEIRGQVHAIGQVTATAAAGRTSVATPVAPKTGQSGLSNMGENPEWALLLVVVAVVVVAGGRVLAQRYR
jgi:hypothetical protein